jgi:hypothetical protein
MKAATFADDVLVLDYFAGGADTGLVTFGANWFAQTFTASESYTITGVQIPAYRVGNPGNITASIKTTAAGVPAVAADLTSGTYDGNTLTTDTGGQWIDIAFTTDYALTSGTTYAIVIRAIAGGAANYVVWLADTANGYSGGQECSSINSGGAWAAVPANDCLFEILVRGGASLSIGHRYEMRLLGTQFDVSQIATNWGLSNMWVSTIIWLVAAIVICVAIAFATNAWDCWWIIMCIMAAYGWRAGFADTYLLVGMLAMSMIGVVYAVWWKKNY